MKTDMSILLATIQHKVVVGTYVNQLWDTFSDTLQESINNHIPQKIAKANSTVSLGILLFKDRNKIEER